MIPGRFLDVLAEYRGKKVLVLCHDDADSDALGAAWVLADLLGGKTGVPRTISEHARELQFRLKMQIVYGPNPEDYDLTIVVDTADAQQLPDCVPAKYLLVDHHSNNTLARGALAAFVEEADATCLLVWRICQRLGYKLQSYHSLALGAGIIGDTRYLATAANSTIADLAAILEEGGVSFQQLLDIFRISSGIDREIRLEAALSAQLHRIGNCLAVSAVVRKNYVYYIAMMLVELGADIALVGYQQGDDCFIRLAKNPAAVPCLDCYAIMSEAAAGYSRTNLWGDADYAGFNGQAPTAEVIGKIISALRAAEARDGSCQCSQQQDK